MWHQKRNNLTSSNIAWQAFKKNLWRNVLWCIWKVNIDFQTLPFLSGLLEPQGEIIAKAAALCLLCTFMCMWAQAHGYIHLHALYLCLSSSPHLFIKVGHTHRHQLTKDRFCFIKFEPCNEKNSERTSSSFSFIFAHFLSASRVWFPFKRTGKDEKCWTMKSCRAITDDGAFAIMWRICNWRHRDIFINNAFWLCVIESDMLRFSKLLFPLNDRSFLKVTQCETDRQTHDEL